MKNEKIFIINKTFTNNNNKLLLLNHKHNEFHKTKRKTI